MAAGYDRMLSSRPSTALACASSTWERSAFEEVADGKERGQLQQMSAIETPLNARYGPEDMYSLFLFIICGIVGRPWSSLCLSNG